VAQVVLVTVSSVVVAAVTGDVDVASGSHLERELADAVEDDHSALVVDLRRVSFFDSTGLNAMVHLWRSLAEEGRQLHVVVREASFTARIFDITGMESVMPVHRRVGAALAAAGARCYPQP
jgi:anti-anti-sigma factor